MGKVQPKKGILHDLTDDISKVLSDNEVLLEKWNGLTEIMRNEWICWITMPKTKETRKEHLKRMQEEILSGEKRPCCWPGCPHRNNKNMKWFEKKMEKLVCEVKE